VYYIVTDNIQLLGMNNNMFFILYVFVFICNHVITRANVFFFTACTSNSIFGVGKPKNKDDNVDANTSMFI